jgi:MOSC domain-containing protein
MAESRTGKVRAIFRYPVKGLSAEALDRVTAEAGESLPFDRAWAIENGPGRFDPEQPKHLPKIHFLMLMRNERLAALETRFDEASQTLTILRAGKQVARGDLTTKIGRTMLEQFLAAYMKDDLRGPPRIVSAPGHTFSDMAARCLHLVNLASLAELESAARRSLDPLRFRPNLVLEGTQAWEEFGWIDRDVAIGDVRVHVFARTTRCAATNVDPATGARDTALPAVLERTWGHADFGVYARVVEGGTIAIGDPVRTP